MKRQQWEWEAWALHAESLPNPADREWDEGTGLKELCSVRALFKSQSGRWPTKSHLNPFLSAILRLKYSMWEFFQQQLWNLFRDQIWMLPSSQGGVELPNNNLRWMTTLSSLALWRPKGLLGAPPHLPSPLPGAWTLWAPSSPLQTAAVCTVARLWEAGVIRANSAKLNCSFVHHYHKNFM